MTKHIKILLQLLHYSAKTIIIKYKFDKNHYAKITIPFGNVHISALVIFLL